MDKLPPIATEEEGDEDDGIISSSSLFKFSSSSCFACTGFIMCVCGTETPLLVDDSPSLFAAAGIISSAASNHQQR